MANLFAKRGEAAPYRGSPGKICYAIGDVHGRLDLLDDLLAQIARHRTTRRAAEAHVVVLGDVIDRGPDSRGVVARLREGLNFDARLHLLKGNHEDMLLEALSGAPERIRTWLDNGGYACARSYGVEVGALFGQTAAELEETLLQHIPTEDLTFLDGFLDSIRFGDYFLVHAGVRPGRPLSEQSAHDMRWIRRPFLESTADHGAVVVHGHSTTAEVEGRPNRIGIDTGAWKSGVLTALWIEERERGMLHAKGRPSAEDSWFG